MTGKPTLIWRDYDDCYQPIWIADDWQATLIDLDSGRVLAYVSDDGCGKYYPTLFVSPWRAYQIMKAQPCYVSSLLSFPRIALDLLRLKVDSLGEAQRVVQIILDDGA
jgi:hypothetical protein